MFAVFESGGKQHRVSEGELVKLEKLDSNLGDAVVFEKVSVSYTHLTLPTSDLV